MNTNENQNLGSVVPPTTVEGPNPVPMNAGPVPSVPPVAPPETMNMNPMPNPIPSGVVEGSVNPQPVPNVGMQEVPVQPMQQMNLQPEGTVTQAPPTPEPTVAEPLMGTTLNDQTVLNPTQAPGMSPMGGSPNPVGTPPPMGMGPVPPMNNNMGMMGGIPTPPTMPPAKNEKPKKKFNPILIVLIVVLIAGVGFAVYYFLNTSQIKTSVTISPLLTEVELGSTLDEGVSAYARVTGMSAENCTVESNVNPSKAGTYQYTVKCGDKTSGPHTVNVLDTMPPEVITKDVIVLPDTVVEATDFIDEVEDASEYTVDFEEEPDTSATGDYEVTLIITDDYDNETTVTANLTVDDNAPDYYLSCVESIESETTKYENAKIEYNYKYGISLNGEFYNALKNVVYQFDEEEDYLLAKEDILDDEFDGIKGKVRSNDKEMTITIFNYLTLDDLADEYELDEFPTLDTDIENIYLDAGNSCDME